MKLLSAEQMAENLSISKKTFNRYLVKYCLPFYQIGRMKRFNEAEVLACLKHKESLPEIKPKKKFNYTFSQDEERFAKMLE